MTQEVMQAAIDPSKGMGTDLQDMRYDQFLKPEGVIGSA
tara:strand:+ start:159 stop:275 length:117 start_codon:yes stop_codon:yes gene_type:complete